MPWSDNDLDKDVWPRPPLHQPEIIYGHLRSGIRSRCLGDKVINEDFEQNYCTQSQQTFPSRDDLSLQLSRLPDLNGAWTRAPLSLLASYGGKFTFLGTLFGVLNFSWFLK